MTKLYFYSTFFILFLFAPYQTKASYGYWGSAVYLEVGGSSSFYNCYNNNIGTVPFIGSLGTFAQNSGTLKLQGGEMKTWKESGSNVCAPVMHYNIHSGSAGSFTPVELPNFCNCSGLTFNACGGGSCSNNDTDQKWQYPGNAGAVLGIDLTNRAPGTYILQVYFAVPGSNSSTSNCNDLIYDSNSGSDYTMTFTIAAPMPVTLTAFDAKVANHYTLLEWSTASEINNDYFEVQYSMDGFSFKNIGQVDGNDTNNLRSKYNFQHNELPTPIAYYRLKQFDYDGRFEYSPVINVRATSSNIEPLFSPNPTKEGITIRGLQDGTMITLMDVHGKILRNVPSSDELYMDLHDLSSGLYIITIVQQNEIKSYKIIKE
jgi:hypothetical protein